VPQHVSLDQLAVHLVVRHCVRPGADDAHPALQHVDELRQLVERGPAHESAQRRDARVTLGALRDLGAVFRDLHGAELVDHDFVAIEAVAALLEDRRAGRAQLDEEREREEQRRDQRQDRERQDDVARALDQPVHPGEGRIAHADDRHAPHRVDAPLDQVRDEHVRNEIDRGRGVAQRVEHAENARLRHHWKRQVDELDVVLLHQLGQLLDLAQHREIARARQAAAVAVVDEPEHPDVRVEVVAEAPRQLDARLVHARQQRALRPAAEPAHRQRGLPQQEQRADLARRRHPPPREQRVAVEIL
jgi:hypothetical protein